MEISKDKFTALLADHDLQLVVFLTRYNNDKFGAYLATVDGEDVLSCILTGSNDDEVIAVTVLCHQDWYPYATGVDMTDAIANLQRKIMPYIDKENEYRWASAVTNASGANLNNLAKINLLIRKYTGAFPQNRFR